MSEIPGSRPDPGPQLSSESISPQINPSAVSRNDLEMGAIAGEFGKQLLHLQQSQDIVQGTMAMDSQLDKVQQDIVQSNDYKGYGHTFDSAISSASDHINANYDGLVKTELLNRLTAQQITRSHDLDAWSYKQTIGAHQQTMQDHLIQLQKSMAYTTGDARTMNKQLGIADIQSNTGVGKMWSDEEGAQVLRNFKETGDYGTAVTDLDKDPRLTLKLLKDPKQYPDITPEQRAALTSEAQRQDKLITAQDRAGLDARTSSDLLGMYYGHGHDATLDIAHMKSDTPDDLKEYKATVATAKEFGAARQELMSAPVDQMPGVLSKYNPAGDAENYMRGNTIGKSGPQGGKITDRGDFDTRVKMYNMLQQDFVQRKQAADTDAPSLTWNDASQNIPDWQHHLNSVIAASDGGLVKLGVLRADGQGKPVGTRGIPAAYVDVLTQQYNSADAIGKQGMLDSLKHSAGPAYYQQIVSQMYSTKKMPPSIVSADDITPATMKDLNAAELIPDENKKQTLGESKYNSLMDDVRKAMQPVIPTLGGPTVDNSDISKNLFNLAYMNQQRNVSDPVGTAFKQLFNDPQHGYQFSGTWRVPNGIDADMMKDYGRFAIRNMKGILGEGQAEFNMKQAELQNGNNWVFHDGVNKLDGTFYLRDSEGHQIQDLDGKNITFRIQDAYNWDQRGRQGSKAPTEQDYDKLVGSSDHLDGVPTPTAVP